MTFLYQNDNQEIKLSLKYMYMPSNRHMLQTKSHRLGPSEWNTTAEEICTGRKLKKSNKMSNVGLSYSLQAVCELSEKATDQWSLPL